MSIELKHHHGGVSVPNLNESISGYKRVLDFEVEKLFEVPGAEPMSPDRRIPDRDVHTHGNKHLAFAIRDVNPLALAAALHGRLLICSCGSRVVAASGAPVRKSTISSRRCIASL